MDSRQTLLSMRQEYHLRMRQQQLKAQRLRFQQALMKNLLVYNSLNEELVKALYQKDSNSLLHIIEDMAAQPLFFSGIFNSGILCTFIKIIKENRSDEYKDEDEEQIDTSMFTIEEENDSIPVINKILLALSKTVYDTEDGLKGMLKAVWPLLSSDVFQQVKLTLTIFTNVLRDQPTCHNILINFGLVKEVCQFIKEEIDIKQEEDEIGVFRNNVNGIGEDESPLQHVLLDLVSNHLILLEKQQRKECKDLKEKPFLECISTPQYDYFLKFAVSNLIQSNHVKTSIQVLRALIEYIPAYIECISQKTISRVIGYLCKQDVQISRSVLLFFDSMGYYASSDCLQTIYRCGILEALDKQLYLEETLKDSKQQQRIQSMSFIICNFLGAKNDHLVKTVRKHPILDHIFGYIQPGHRLIRMARVFDYYFRSFRPGDDYRDVLDAILEAVSVLDIQSQEATILRQTIVEVYYNSVDKKNIELQEHLENKLVRLGMIDILEPYTE